MHAGQGGGGGASVLPALYSNRPVQSVIIIAANVQRAGLSVSFVFVFLINFIVNNFFLLLKSFVLLIKLTSFFLSDDGEQQGILLGLTFHFSRWLPPLSVTTYR